MKKILVFGAILTNMLILEGRNSAFATKYKDRGSGAIFEITESDNLPTKIPETQALVAGTLDTTGVRTFDLVVAGNCKVGGGTVGLDVVPGEKRPDLFTLDNGVIKFADPQRLGVFTMPRGHDETVTVSIVEIRDKESGKTTPATDIKRARDYLCLGIRQKEKPIQIIYKSGNASTATASIDLKGGEEFELVPLVSTSKVSTACDAVKQKSDIPAGFITGNAIDFSAVYRVNVTIGIDQSIPKTATWEEKECVFGDDITSLKILAHAAIGPIDGKKQIIAQCNDGLAISEDGITWNKLDSDFTSSKTSSSWIVVKFAYGNYQWWGIDNGNFLFSKNAINWGIKSQTVSTYGIEAMAFGDKRFMAVTGDKKIYTLLEGETDWHQPAEEKLRTISGGYYSIIIYGNGRWICAGYGNSPTLVYDVGDEESGWKNLGDSGIPVGGEYPHGGWYAHGYFYAAGCEGEIYKLKFPGGTRWELDWSGNGAGDNITYFEKTDKLYAYSYDETKVLVGSFND